MENITDAMLYNAFNLKILISRAHVFALDEFIAVCFTSFLVGVFGHIKFNKTSHSLYKDTRSYTQRSDINNVPFILNYLPRWSTFSTTCEQLKYIRLEMKGIKYIGQVM